MKCGTCSNLIHCQGHWNWRRIQCCEPIRVIHSTNEATVCADPAPPSADGSARRFRQVLGAIRQERQGREARRTGISQQISLLFKVILSHKMKRNSVAAHSTCLLLSSEHRPRSSEWRPCSHHQAWGGGHCLRHSTLMARSTGNFTLPHCLGIRHQAE